jgi:hypothetical protein
MSAVQIGFNLRTSSTVKTVHLVGSWDNYTGQLPLSHDRASKAGAWKGTFRFQGETLKPGQRYWYYYIIDGYHVSHDPGQASTTESTTGRVLNILDVPPSSGKSSKSSKSSSSSKSSKSSSSGKSSSKHSSSSRREARAASTDIPKGRPLSVSQIVSPMPVSPHATKAILETEYDALEAATVADLTSRFSYTTLHDEDDSDDEYPSSTGSSLSSRSDSTLSSNSDISTASSCSCERYGITRAGERIKLDCGGSRCGYSDEDSCCSSSDDDYVPRSTRRQGIVVRR